MIEYPLVSIITAAYNSEKYIEDTIKSVICQSYPYIEYIVIDGASKDNTLSIVKKYEDKISKIISEPDKGVYDAFNKGLKAASGDIIYFLNSDDYLYDSSVISDVVGKFMSNSETSIVYGDIHAWNEDTGFFLIWGQEVNIDSFKKGIMPGHPATFVKKELYNLHGYFSTEYKIASDFELMAKFFLTHESRALYYPRKVAVFRLGGLSSNPNTTALMSLEKEKIIEKLFSTSIHQQENLSDINIEFYRLWIENILVYERYISKPLKEQGVKSVAIFGTKYTAIYLLNDLKNSGISVAAFLDNDIRRQGNEIKGIPVCSPSWLKENKDAVDAIILSFEGSFDDEIVQQINSLIGYDKPIYSWKDLIRWCYKI
ncbi:glycosyltransferase family 2 protein [Aneurinibacillus sp. UBA3580]|jgi:glycosyltransferase involved in cell wall biosynthesis|uniref:glycosyltransferase family 2 protein n=1 Tax=Aneurinibacillus sp. UBA3580 TaxID=1946041 RepID=UPI00257B2D18|nr:glycosyltransferase family 2 protein [Aneurinibacillus sp. UBA3580]